MQTRNSVKNGLVTGGRRKDPNENRPGYKKTKVGWLPDRWDVLKVENVAIVNPETLGENTQQEYLFIYIDLASVKEGKIDVPESMITFAEAPCRARRVARYGDVLLATVRPNLKGFAYLGTPIHNLICSTGFAILRCKNHFDGSFLYHSLYTNASMRYFHGCVVGSGYPALNNSDVKNLKLASPPLPEQKKIAAILSTWDEAIEQTRKLIEAKKRRKNALVQQLLTGKKRLPGFASSERTHLTPLGELSVDWPLRKLGEIFTKVRRKNDKGINLVFTASGENGLVDQQSYFTKSVAAQDVSGYYLLRRGEFAYNRSAMAGYPYGAVKRLDRYEHGVLSTLYSCFALADDDCDSDFYTCFFETGLLNRQLRGITHVGGRAHGLLNVVDSDFYAITVPVPTAKEQHAIATVLKTANDEITLLEAELKALEKQKRGLMQKLLTGTIRVRTKERA